MLRPACNRPRVRANVARLCVEDSYVSRERTRIIATMPYRTPCSLAAHLDALRSSMPPVVTLEQRLEQAARIREYFVGAEQPDELTRTEARDRVARLGG